MQRMSASATPGAITPLKSAGYFRKLADLSSRYWPAMSGYHGVRRQARRASAGRRREPCRRSSRRTAASLACRVRIEIAIRTGLPSSSVPERRGMRRARAALSPTQERLFCPFLKRVGRKAPPSRALERRPPLYRGRDAEPCRPTSGAFAFLQRARQLEELYPVRRRPHKPRGTLCLRL
jgi:hypothetical protein